MTSPAAIAAPLPSSPTPPSAPVDPGLISLTRIARFHGIAVDNDQLKHTAAKHSEAFDVNDLMLAARGLGLKVRCVKVNVQRLSRAPFPALALDHEGEHFVLAGCDADKALVLDATAGQPKVVKPEEVLARSTGYMLFFASRASLAGDLARFDFSWFIPVIVKYRRLLLEVLVVSAVLQIFGLVSPLMFQVVMDKVLVNRAYSTLNVVCVALLVSSVFEVLLTGLRNYVFSHTSSRVDVELGGR